MKIIYIYPYFGTPKGGWSTRVYEFARRWKKEGVDVTVITSPYYKSDISASGIVDKQEIEGIKLIVVNSPDSNKASLLNRVFNALKFSAFALYYSMTLNYDVIVSSSGPITTALPGLISKFFRRKKFIFEVRDLWPTGAIELRLIKHPILIKFGLWFEKICYKNADLVATCSTGMQEGVLRVWPYAKTIVAPNSSDNELFKRTGDTPDDFPHEWKGRKVFVYTGSLGLMDDCLQILQGFMQTSELNICLAVVGDGAEKADLERFVQSNNLDDKIRFFGLIPKEEVVRWYNVSTASFVTFKNLPVLHTSSPNKMFDSFAAGVPIIQNTMGWIRELVENEKCGINVLPEDASAMGKAIDLMATNSEIQLLMAKNAARLGATSFDRTYVSNLYLNGIREVYR